MNKQMLWKETRIFVYCLLAAALGVLVGSHSWAARPPIQTVAAATLTAPSMESSFAPVVDKALPAVVNISSSKTTKQSEMAPLQMDPFFRQFFGNDLGRQFNAPRNRTEHSLGSGVIVRSDGYLLTNNHVIDGASDITVTLGDKRELKAKVIGADPKTDIAVLKVDASNLPTLAMADSSKARVGDIVLAMGNPFGLGQTVTMGIISAEGRTNLGIEDYEDFIQTDAPINPGNSGGALINTRGELVGINTAILANNGGNQGVGFAVPMNLAHSVMTQVMDHGKVVRGYLGVVPENITPALARAFNLKPSQQGVLMGDVTPDAPAGKAGIERGDVITEVNGEKIEDANQLRMRISLMAPGANANLKVLHSGSEKTVAVKLGELPGAAAHSDERGSVEGGTASALDGVSVDALDAQTAREMRLPASAHGVVVTDVEEGSTAWSAGLRQGDVIQEVNRKPVASVNEFDRALHNASGGNVLLLVNRNGFTQFIAIQK
ncbi:MAG TPA: DegQ family serine endoprotease [Bryobacteraceae bacterium]|nr:DegQ family serine endoprotease [Bryobacteraceae bacterium]